LKAHQNGIAIESIATITELTVEEVNDILKQQGLLQTPRL
jgi:ribosome-interacting GTPase 1